MSGGLNKAGKQSFLFVTWEGGGSAPPVFAAAERMVKRGHRVRVLTDACHREEVAAAGAEFIPYNRAPSRPDKTRETDFSREWEAASGPEAIQRVIDNVFCGPALAYAQDLMDELAREPADLVVSSELLFGIGAACEAIGQKLALLPVNPLFAPMPGAVPMGAGLTPARSDEERAAHMEMAAMVTGLFDLGLPALNRARDALGLAPLAHAFDQTWRADRILIATSRAFDFGPDILPANVRYVGPLLGGVNWARSWVSPWSESDTRPLILVGFSTTFQNQADCLQRMVDAIAGLPARALVTLGGTLHAHEVRGAANVAVVDTAPHDSVMREATLVVTHGGHGTTLRALSHRLPMLVVPHGRDQNDIAARVTARGAGLMLEPSASTEEMRGALQALLETESFRQAAEALGDKVLADIANSPFAEELEDLATQHFLPDRTPQICLA